MGSLRSSHGRACKPHTHHREDQNETNFSTSSLSDVVKKSFHRRLIGADRRMIGDFPTFPWFSSHTYIARASPWFSSRFTRLTYIGRGIFNKTLQQNNPKIQSIHHFKTFYYGKWKKKKYMYIRKKFWNRRMDWILGFLPFTSTRYTQNTGFQRTFVIFDPSKFSKITHFDPSRGRKLYFGHFRSIKCLSQARKKVKSRDFRGFYMTSLISRQSAVGEITYISGIV